MRWCHRSFWRVRSSLQDDTAGTRRRRWPQWTEEEGEPSKSSSLNIQYMQKRKRRKHTQAPQPATVPHPHCMGSCSVATAGRPAARCPPSPCRKSDSWHGVAWRGSDTPEATRRTRRRALTQAPMPPLLRPAWGQKEASPELMPFRTPHLGGRSSRCALACLPTSSAKHSQMLFSHRRIISSKVLLPREPGTLAFLHFKPRPTSAQLGSQAGGP